MQVSKSNPKVWNISSDPKIRSKFEIKNRYEMGNRNDFSRAIEIIKTISRLTISIYLIADMIFEIWFEKIIKKQRNIGQVSRSVPEVINYFWSCSKPFLMFSVIFFQNFWNQKRNFFKSILTSWSRKSRSCQNLLNLSVN